MKDQNMEPVFMNQDVNVIRSWPNDDYQYIRAHHRRLDWDYNVLVQFRINPIELPFRIEFEDDDYDKLTLAVVTDRHKVTTYEFYYEHYVVYPQFSKYLFFNGTLEFCKTDTKLCAYVIEIYNYFIKYSELTVRDGH